MSNIVPPPEAVSIEVNGREIDPNDHYAKDARNTDHIIVSSDHILTTSERSKLQDLKVELLEDLGSNNLLCQYAPSDLQSIRRLDFIRQVDVYRNVFKIPSALQQVVEQAKDVPEAATETLKIDVMVYQETDLKALADSM